MPGLAFPKTREQQRDYWRRSQPPVEKYLHVVPNPRRQFHQIRNNEAQSKWQIEKQKLARHQVIIALPEQRGDQKRNESARVRQPKPGDVRRAVQPCSNRRCGIQRLWLYMRAK